MGTGATRDSDRPCLGLGQNPANQIQGKPRRSHLGIFRLSGLIVTKHTLRGPVQQVLWFLWLVSLHSRLNKTGFKREQRLLARHGKHLPTALPATETPEPTNNRLIYSASPSPSRDAASPPAARGQRGSPAPCWWSPVIAAAPSFITCTLVSCNSPRSICCES